MYRYSVFLPNVGTCSDRYCGRYAEPFPIEELVQRAASIPRLQGLDLVATPDLMRRAGELESLLGDAGLQCVSIAADIFSQGRWRQGSLCSGDEQVRTAAVAHCREVMDLCAELGSDLLTLWPGQDGYDYIFQADFIAERERFIASVQEICDHRPDMRVGLEYKQKEPRIRSYVNTVGTTLLMIQAVQRAQCGLILDYGHALLGGENPAESVAICKQFGDRLFHIHINDNYRAWDDDLIVGSVHTHEFLEFFYWLRRTGYEGWITCDQFPYREDGRDAVCESTEWLALLEARLDAADPQAIEATLRAKDGVASSRLLRGLSTAAVEVQA
ncbi:MAG: sugar phosphate isomerase/epimerase family protein [Planctomycetota bacterium]